MTETPAMKQPDPCAMVIFGAGGDLTKRLLVPALYNLAKTGLIPDNFLIIGADIADRQSKEWASSLQTELAEFAGNASAEDQIRDVDPAVWAKLAGRMHYLQGDFTRDEFYHTLADKLGALEQSHATAGNRLFYLAVADRFFGPIVTHLGAAKLTVQDKGAKPWRRVVIEKPFGHSLQSARALNQTILQSLAESQIYRIDHFLGKETVQNILALRFANSLFEPLWNRDRIDHVQITVAETVGVESRGKFYDVTGALRDMVPNHVFQLLAMVTMEPPTGFRPEAIRDKKFDLFTGLETLRAEDVVRGQYEAGTINGQSCVAYRAEPNVAPDTKTETYVAMRVRINNWRWAGVPFYIRTGKHLPARLTEIAIRFKQAPLAAFQDMSLETLPPNWLILRIQPDEGISLKFEAKHPGQTMRLAPVAMEFRYTDWFTPQPNIGYETLLYDCMIGDQTLFQRADMVEETWRVVQPVLDLWAADPAPIPTYRSGDSGPKAADALLSDDAKERVWRAIALPQPHQAS